MQVKTHTGDILFPNKYKNVTFSQTQVRFVNSENDILTLPINQVIIETQNANNNEVKELENIIDELVDIAQSNGIDVYVSNGKVVNRGVNHNVTHHTETHITEEDDGVGDFVVGAALGLGLGLLF